MGVQRPAEHRLSTGSKKNRIVTRNSKLPLTLSIRCFLNPLGNRHPISPHRVSLSPRLLLRHFPLFKLVAGSLSMADAQTRTPIIRPRAGSLFCPSL